MSTPKGYVKNEYGCICGETNPIEFYGKQKVQCKKCFNNMQKLKWKGNKLRAIEIKGGKCVFCDYNKCVGALEFHHIDPSVKEHNWSRKWMLSWDKIEAAIEHTILLCANCHREEHERLRLDCTD